MRWFSFSCVWSVLEHQNQLKFILKIRAKFSLKLELSTVVIYKIVFFLEISLRLEIWGNIEFRLS